MKYERKVKMSRVSHVHSDGSRSHVTIIFVCSFKVNVRTKVLSNISSKTKISRSEISTRIFKFDVCI